uniref:H1.10 linker histone n=1 Tax=Eptatretus burgeri TaxID=7764 RepID=A0A8C4R117_EPTBU
MSASGVEMAPASATTENNAKSTKKGKAGHTSFKQSPRKRATSSVSRNTKTSVSRSSKRKNQPGKYSRLVQDVILRLGDRGGSSLAKIYREAKTEDWFDQQHGRMYLKYAVKALVENRTLVQISGSGANGSFMLNKKGKNDSEPDKIKKATQRSHKAKPVASKATPKKAKSSVAKNVKSTSKKVNKSKGSTGKQKKSKRNVPKHPKSRKA